MAYSTPADVYALGLPPEAFARPPRQIEGVIPGSGTLQLRAHGLAADTPLTLAVLSSSVLGAPAAALPGGTSESTQYYWQPNGSDLGRLSTTPGGSPIASFSDAGSGLFGIVVDHIAYLVPCIAAGDSLIEAYVVAHRAPFQASVLKLVSTYLGARIYMTAHAFGNPAFSKMLEPPVWLAKLIDKLFDLWISGAPLPAGSTDATPGVAEDSAQLVDLDSRGFLDDAEEYGRV